eukprot:m.213341 g.213341  ORF g.213341 m.213341 type:complete len:574 (+) comp54028_c0_seq1:30-1751(+)
MLTLNILYCAYLFLVAVEEALLIAFISWQRRKARAEDGTSASALLPRYRHVLHVFIFQQAANGLLGLWFMRFGKKGSAPQSLLLFSQILEHTFSEGSLFLLISKSVGLNAFVRSFVTAFVWSLIPALVWSCGNKWPYQTFSNNPPWSEINIIIYCIQIVFHSMVAFLPRSFWFRRPSCRVAAIALIISNAFSLALSFVSRDMISLSSTELVLFACYLAASALEPLAFCYAFQQDSQYWSAYGAYKHGGPTRASETTPILGQPHRSIMKELVDVSDSLSDFMINFEKLQFDSAQHLGQGAGARVFPGTLGHEKVAIKMLFQDELTEDMVRNFQAEASHLHRLKHRNVVKFWGVCVVPPKLCIVLERCEHGSLREYLEKSWHTCQRPQLYRMCSDCCSALTFLHGQAPPLIHNDIKSANFLVKSDHQGGVIVKIADFDISCASCENSRLPTCVMWLAPEIVDTTRAVFTTATDVYSLALVLWEILVFQDFLQVPPAFPNFRAGERPVLPDSLDLSIRLAINSGWHMDPQKRLSAVKLKDAFGAVTSSSAQTITSTSSLRSFDAAFSPGRSLRMNP